MDRNALVAIAGGGIAGLTTALALTRRGFAVRVYERRAADAPETGAGLQLSPNAMHALAAIGAADAVAANASEPTEIAVREGYLGAQLAQLPLGAAARQRYGAPYLQIARGDLRTALLNCAREAGVDIRFATAVDDYSGKGDRIRLTLASGASEQAHILVLADGVHSRLAGRLGGDMPRYAGYVAWRALIPMARLAAHQQRPVTTLWVGDGGHVVTYPIGQGRWLNLLACCTRDNWTSKRWSEPARAGEVATVFRRWHRDVRALLNAADDVYVWALHHREPLARWFAGRVVAVGDACHPILPFAAQGAAQATEDALVLAAAMADHDTPAAAFAAFQQSRENRVRAVFDESVARAGLYHRGPLKRVFGLALPGAERPGTHGAYGGVDTRFDWLYGYDAGVERMT